MKYTLHVNLLVGPDKYVVTFSIYKTGKKGTTLDVPRYDALCAVTMLRFLERKSLSGVLYQPAFGRLNRTTVGGVDWVKKKIFRYSLVFLKELLISTIFPFSITKPKFYSKRILYYCSSAVDEIWIRPLAFEGKKSGLDCSVVIVGIENDISPEVRTLYSQSNVPLEFVVSNSEMSQIQAEIVVTSSSGVKRQIFSGSVLSCSSTFVN